MRLWTLHPKYLDVKGLTAAWREGLLAQRVLSGATRGYTRHPQLLRFRAAADPMAAIGAYLRGIHAEAVRRGYRFDAGRIVCARGCAALAETDGQLLFEWSHLRHKLETRDAARFALLRGIAHPDCHPMFRIVPGPVRDWEKGADP